MREPGTNWGCLIAIVASLFVVAVLALWVLAGLR